MDTLNQGQVQEFFAKTRITVADPSLRIGRELSYRPSPRRTVIVHFGRDAQPEYIKHTVAIILSSQDSWVLIARFGPATKLGSLTTLAEAEALLFAPSERDQLAKYLSTRDMTMGSVSQDIYAVGANGNTIVTWDHHSHDEGLRIELRDVQESSTLLTKLNDFGSELEVFAADG